MRSRGKMRVLERMEERRPEVASAVPGRREVRILVLVGGFGLSLPVRFPDSGGDDAEEDLPEVEKSNASGGCRVS